jgi:hypothetical protein
VVRLLECAAQLLDMLHQLLRSLRSLHLYHPTPISTEHVVL